MTYSVTQNLILYKLGASNIFWGQMATTVNVGWFAGRSLIIKIGCIHNCHECCAYFCNMCAIYICDRRRQTGQTRQKTLKRFRATGKIRTENFEKSKQPAIYRNGCNYRGVVGEFTRGLFFQEQERLFTHLDGRKYVTSSMFFFCTSVDLIEFFLFRLVCLCSSYKTRRLNV